MSSEGAKVGQAFQEKGREAATAIKSTMPEAISNVQQIAKMATGAVQKGIAGGQKGLAQVQAKANTALSQQQGVAGKQLAGTVATAKSGLKQGGQAGQKAAKAQLAGATKALRANAALLKKRLQSAPILREDAGEASGSLKSGLKSLSAHGIVAAGQTAKKVTQATGSGAKSAKSGLSGQAGAAAKGAGSTASHASSGATSLAGNVSGQVKNTATSATQTGDKSVTSYSGKVKTATGKVKSKFQSGMSSTKSEMDAHATKVQGGTQKIPGDTGAKISQGQAKVNAEASKEPEKDDSLWGKVKSAAKWVAEKLKAAFEFVGKLLTDPGFWVSLIVAVALAAFVIATFGSGLAVILVGGAIIGAISAGAGTITSNLVAGRKWNEGLGTSMLIGGLLGPLGMTGIGGVFSSAGSAFARTAVGKTVVGIGQKIASNSAVKAVTNVASRVGTRAIQGMRGLGSKAGQVLTAPFRKAKDVFLRAKDAIRRRLIRTKPSGKPNPNAKPGGTRTKIPKKDTPDNQRNYELENESADALSQQGYNVEQNPKVPGAKNPDYAVEGNIFDNFSAKANTSVRNLWSTAKSKVEKGQTRRVTINLTDWKGDLNALKAQFREWRIPDLDEALAILPDGSIVRLL